ncbi:RNA polymerase II transcription factor SIII (Elongin) subunit A [Nesidiocoris tenuis]|uniref:RNA polymerase II transcription factor SIII (Elongin) subunit A n=1 Tax=Nesidiocoris tenuis TaxID=355587 RepID=A0ABN7AJC7_9HEMI|nr:RNA polymerase II transcription factor SIII (Elongin) subunit A [Nesidiocoris tenuis]
MSNKSIVDQIRHYQKDIERCPENSERMMRCIQRLYVMPILVQHLQETGIGRSVNSLKKNSGEVGDAAKALVNKWKKMVAEEESDDACNNSLEKTDDSKNPPASDGIESSSKTRKVSNDRPKVDSKNPDHSSKQKRSHPENDGSKGDKKSRSSSKDVRKDEKSSSSSKDKRHEKSHRSESSHKRKEDSSKKSSSSGREHSRSELNKSEQTDKKKSKESSEHRHSKSSHSSKEQHCKERSRNGSDRDVDDGSPLPKKRKKTCVKERRKHRNSSVSSSDREKSPASESDDDGRSPDSGRDDGDSDSSDEVRNRDLDGNSDEASTKELTRPERQKTSSHSTSSSKSKPKESSKDKILENGKRIKQEKVDPAYEGYSSPSVKGSPSPGNMKNKISKIKVDTSNDDGIDAGSGFSFADALAGLDPSSGKKKKKSIKPDLIVTTPSSSTKSHSSKPGSKKEKPSTSSKDHHLSRNSPSMPSCSVKREPSSGSPMPELLMKKPLKLENLDLDINSTLPEINPNYRPLPHVPENARRNSTTKTITNDEEMFSMMMNKNQRTKVFSGGKSTGRVNKVPSLYELCIKLLYDNIDGLEFTGGVPFDLLKPLLEKLNPDQLFVLEHYNSYLIEDTGPMWEFHCKKDFRTATRQDMETWRELYVRCMEEREEKLKALTQNITKSIAQSVPVRKAQLAYVNSAVKPPRNVAKKQAKYGTGDSSGICPSLKSNSAEKREILNKAVVGASNGNVLATTTVPPPPPASAPRATSSWSAPVAPQSQKKRKAPLMAKTLQLMKGNRFKR